ncbi:hypothetical protein P3T76_009032 [Phytophthora citrophthora]|uniref:DUF7587 domain-containing protein n=1 Tax=Phytophthora citrophthora TaxID=4793 RepID=A0AAD9GIE9_9STRA|nr:hypothetical protein P3T76_009032 [Phytophthora citrophthora]
MAPNEVSSDNIVRRYKCSDNDKPFRLYRVQYGGNTSFTARCEPSFHSENEFKISVEQHLNWGNRYPTPFVSTFADCRHAKYWARQRVKNGARYVVILEIDPSQLGPIFRVLQLVRDYGVSTNLLEHMYRDEYLILQKIRKRSIIGTEVIRRDDPDESGDDESDESDDSASITLSTNSASTLTVNRLTAFMLSK